MPTLRKTAPKNQLPTPDLAVLAEESLSVTQDLGKVLQTPSRLSFPEKLKKFQNAEKCMFTAPRSKGDITGDSNEEQPTPLSVVTSTPSVDRFGKTVSSQQRRWAKSSGANDQLELLLECSKNS
jgi:hypothetical protein